MAVHPPGQPGVASWAAPTPTPAARAAAEQQRKDAARERREEAQRAEAARAAERLAAARSTRNAVTPSPHQAPRAGIGDAKGSDGSIIKTFPQSKVSGSGMSPFEVFQKKIVSEVKFQNPRFSHLKCFLEVFPAMCFRSEQLSI